MYCLRLFVSLIHPNCDADAFGSENISIISGPAVCRIFLCAVRGCVAVCYSTVPLETAAADLIMVVVDFTRILMYSLSLLRPGRL